MFALQSSVFTYEDKSLYEKVASNVSEQVDVNESSTVDARSQREQDDGRPAGDVPAGGLSSGLGSGRRETRNEPG